MLLTTDFDFQSIIDAITGFFADFDFQSIIDSITEFFSGLFDTTA